MSAVAETSLDAAAGDRLARRNAFILAVAQALAGGNNVVLIATGAIVGAMLAPDRSLATVPVSIYVVGMWMGALPRGWIARHYGRQVSFFVGTAFGVLSGLFACAAVVTASFTLLCIGAIFTGLYQSVVQSYRFAAADTASDNFRPKAISWVMLGGIFAGLFGSQLVIGTKDLWQPYLFAGTFLAQSAVALISAAVLALVKIPMPPPHVTANPGRPLAEIARQPRFIAAVACGVASYSMMNMVMTSAPLAMVDCNHTVGEATLGIQWHILGMFVPSLFTGSLILRFGVERIVGLGLALLDRERDHQHRRHFALALLDRAHAARRRLEFRLRRRHHHGDPVPPPGGAQQGAVVQRLPGVRLDGDRLVRLRHGADELRLGRAQQHRVPGDPGGGRFAHLADAAARAEGSLTLRPVSRAGFSSRRLRA